MSRRVVAFAFALACATSAAAVAAPRYSIDRWNVEDGLINHHTFSIIGVAAKGFSGTDVGSPTDIWLPMLMQREVGRDFLTDARTNWLEILGRLNAGLSLDVHVFMFGLAASVLAGLFVGQTPILASRKVGLTRALANSWWTIPYRRLTVHDRRAERCP